mmetsp:Transcript_4771/g.10347  ORF Transcript_4771/g.10347 Transcript_4771/m.10347 type:complete len:257 (-) Transcript_4771:100-870(-)
MHGSPISMRKPSTVKPTGMGIPRSSADGCGHHWSRRLLADSRRRLIARGSAPLRAGKSTNGVHSALIFGVQYTGSPPRTTASEPELRVLCHPDSFTVCFVPGVASRVCGGTSTRRRSPSSSKVMSACCAGTPQIARLSAHASGVLTSSCLPHCPTAPRLVTREPMVTYSRYCKLSLTGDLSYCKATFPPRVHPKKEIGETPSGSSEASGALQNAGRNHRRPVKRHGNPSASEFLLVRRVVPRSADGFPAVCDKECA